MSLVKITTWNGEKIADDTVDPKYFGTLDTDSGSWPGFLSFDDFKNWPEDYDTYHAPLPNHCSWEEISVNDLPEEIKNLESDGYSILDHIAWMEEPPYDAEDYE